MKKMLMTIVLILGLAVSSYAQVLDLNTPEALAVPTATKLDLRTINIDVSNKAVLVTYRFLAADGGPIPAPGSAVDRTWQCRDIAAFDTARCTAAGVPDACCTGVGTGTGCYAGDTCFTDTFSFVIRTQDAGTPIGKGLRALIWSKMRPAVLTGSNNATLP
jgi:hypothetical protein